MHAGRMHAFARGASGAAHSGHEHRLSRTTRGQLAPVPLLNVRNYPAPSTMANCSAEDTSVDLYIAPSSARSIQSVADLASAWSQVARRLPSTKDQDEMLIIAALKLALAYLQNSPPRLDGRLPGERAVQLASSLADLSAAGLPLDAEAVAAGIVLEACEHANVDHATIKEKLGSGVAVLVHDVLRVRSAPLRVELYSDEAASAVREWCLAFHDVRACAVEVICRWDDLQHMGLKLPVYERQLLALESLQVYAPLGHALGLGPICADIEDLCFKVLFPQSYSHTHNWLCHMLDEAEEALFRCQQDLLAALDTLPSFTELASTCLVRVRTKSLFSIMKKLLRVGNMSQGGRQREEIYDILGMRAIVQPRTDLPPEEAAAAAREACFIVQEVAESLWPPLCDRTKDYISNPKPNGYQSLHLTLCLLPECQMQRHEEPCVTEDFVRSLVVTASMASMDEEMMNAALSAPYLELQIRSKEMDDRAESGDAAHTAYKGGLDSRQARQLQAWTAELHNRLNGRKQAKLMLPEKIDTPLDSSKCSSVEALFRYMDTDGSGRITLEELRANLREMLPKQGHSRAHHLSTHLGQDQESESVDAEALLMLLESVGGDENESLCSEMGGEKGMTLPDFARFLKKVVLVNALSRMDKESITQLKPETL